MNDIINQIRRIFADDGRGDKDFTEQEIKLRQAQDKLKSATEQFVAAANMLIDVIKSQA